MSVVQPWTSFVAGKPAQIPTSARATANASAAYDVSPDVRLLVSMPLKTGIVANSSQQVVVQHWFDELKARVGTMTYADDTVVTLVAHQLDVLGGMNTPQPRSDERTFAIIGAAMEVHRIMRRGFLEAIYHEALAIEFRLRDIPFVTQVPCSVEYKGQRLHGTDGLDFVCFDTVVVEVKASSAATSADYAQVLNYLAVSGHEIALLINFGRPSLQYRRFALSDCV